MATKSSAICSPFIKSMFLVVCSISSAFAVRRTARQGADTTIENISTIFNSLNNKFEKKSFEFFLYTRFHYPRELQKESNNGDKDQHKLRRGVSKVESRKHALFYSESVAEDSSYFRIIDFSLPAADTYQSLRN